MKRIAGKKEVPHGEWLNWLKEKFNLSDRTAQQYIQIAKRFSNTQTSAVFSQSQMVELLRLPAEEAEKFIADRFSKTVDVDRFQFGQLTEMLTLPAGEEEKFIAEKAAEGKGGRTTVPKILDVEN